MNAHAILTAQGWRGTGHSLHPTSDNHGLKHHLLIKRNDDGTGLGHKKADRKAEAWWLNAFDQALKGIDTKTGTMKQTLKGGDLEKITAKGAGKYTGTKGLYSSFVRGGVMGGTIGSNIVSGLPTPPDSSVGTPATASDEEKAKKETKEERKARREAKRLRKAKKLAKKERAAEKVEKKKAKKAERQEIKATETKEERRARRDARRKRKEERRRSKSTSGG